mmetsp:Transcript_42487/g.51559  ORF Transcript_42487/g.51559 Transcript_42487/m.51559 type:complete len:510 (-) Transcript_42487:482-2011(-)|eukprot:CAMPEP_0197852704 /NCGR_PEP_ID=MMETSP1438-20131217/21242_1 /TAXON_ID=1461541 /ORGANISM="Pterosperma sp., Strain CCMP1384" /LENGTH=509 /DNA_ID=CAMNT_0043466865 /DNA_START=78 /DNA_END=1607 /DNA_ORIENTATION=+
MGLLSDLVGGVLKPIMGEEKTGNGMTIVFGAGGSRGDVQPVVALAVGLKKMGFHIIFAAGEEARFFADTYGFEFLTISSMKNQYQNNKPWMEAVSKLDDKVMIVEMANLVNATTEHDTRVIWKRIKDDPSVVCVVTSTLTCPLSFSLSYARKIATVCLFFMPFCPTNGHLPCQLDSQKSPGKDIPKEGWAQTGTMMLHHYYENLWLPSFYLSWKICVDPKCDFEYFKEIFPLQEMMTMVSNQHHRITFLYGISEHLIGGTPDDIPRSTGFGGYLFLPPSDPNTPVGKVNPKLEAFINAGPPPACIGFGSMCMSDKAAILRTVLRSIKRANLRTVILAGWADLDVSYLNDTEEDLELLAYAKGGNVFFESEVAHDWLYPRCCLVVHHGGAGTTAAGLAAGTPAIVMPFGFDQSFMGDCVQKLGCGLRLPAMLHVTADEFYTALVRLTTDVGMIAKAKEVAAKIAMEDGVATLSGQTVQSILKFKPAVACALANESAYPLKHLLPSAESAE